MLSDRGVNLIRIRDGWIVEARGYVKTKGGAAVKLDRTTVCLPIANGSVSNTPYGL